MKEFIAFAAGIGFCLWVSKKNAHIRELEERLKDKDAALNAAMKADVSKETPTSN